MFDYLGTMTETQLRERHVWLSLQLSALSASLEHSRAERDRLIETSTVDVGAGDRTINYTREQQGRTYNLGNTTGSLVSSGKWTMQNQIQLWVENSRYPMRVDPVNNDISFGDTTWKPDARLPSVDNNTIDQVVANDAVASARSVSLIQPFRNVMKRPEYADEKSKKIKYRFLVMSDDITAKEAMIANFDDETAAIEALLANSRTLTNSAGAQETVSEYETVGAEQKQDIVDPGSTENPSLFVIIFPPSQSDDSLAAGEDATETNIRPIVVDSEADRTTILAAVNNQTNADVDTFWGEFWHSDSPKAPSEPIPAFKQQFLANIYAYARDSLQAVAFNDHLYVKDSRPNIFLAPEAAKGLEDFADYIQTTYGLSVRITELWPPTVNHLSLEHFTGYAADITFALNAEKLALDTDFGHGVLTADLVDTMVDAGKNNHFFSGACNEYRKKTKLATGAHLHIQWEGILANHINAAILQNLDAERRNRT